MKKNNIIFILGPGKSGSTFLDSSLGRYLGCISLGEVQEIEWESKNGICGCNKKLKDCKTWKPILKKINKFNTIKLFREKKGSGKRYRLEYFKFIFGFSHKFNINNDYIEQNINLFRILSKNKKEKYLVDSSKDTYRFIQLYFSNKFNLKTIFLYKDPRAWVNSNIRNKRGLKRFLLIFKYSIAYNLDHLIINLVLKKVNKKDYIKLNYLDFLKNMKKNMSIFKTFLNLKKLDRTDFLKRGNFNNHMVAEHKFRLRRNKTIIDERWKIELTKPEKVLISILNIFYLKNFR